MDQSVTNHDYYPFADVTLARRLERAEAKANVDFVEGRAKAFPDKGATWSQIAGTYAMFDGRTSPITQTFGIGMFQPLTERELHTIEKFFLDRHAPVCHEMCPLADSSVLPLLNDRGYQPIEFTSVLYRPISAQSSLPISTNKNIVVRLSTPSERESWSETAFRGWSDFGELAGFLLELGKVNAQRENALCFVAELNGQSIATALMSIVDGVALLAGASTIPEARKQGAQLALLESRLRYAADHGCDIAMMGALPGSASQRNAERHHFRIAYTRVKWQLMNTSLASFS
jgi:GNAT superfamily N-acetyltransferase